MELMLDDQDVLRTNEFGEDAADELLGAEAQRLEDGGRNGNEFGA